MVLQYSLMTGSGPSSALARPPESRWPTIRRTPDLSGSAQGRKALYYPKVQVIGLPASGKSTAIRDYVKQVDDPVTVVDLSSFSGPNREEEFARTVRSCLYTTIAESACGIPRRDFLYTVKLDPGIMKIYQQWEEREGVPADAYYFSLLQDSMVRADYTVSNPDSLVEFLMEVFW